MAPDFFRSKRSYMFFFVAGGSAQLAYIYLLLVYDDGWVEDWPWYSRRNFHNRLPTLIPRGIQSKTVFGEVVIER